MTSSRTVRHALLVGACGIAGPVAASPEVIPAVTVSGGASYSSNPFLTPGTARGGSAVSIEAAPSVEIVDDRTTATISGNLGLTQYTGSLGSMSAYRVQGVVAHRANDRLSLNARAGFDSSILGSRSFNDPSRALPSTQEPVPVGSTATGGATPPVTSAPLFGETRPVLGLGTTIIDSDLGLLGARQRRNLFTASGGLESRISPRSSVSAELSFSRAVYPGGTIATENYTSYGATVGYRRALSEVTSVGAGFGLSRVNYSLSPGSTVYSPHVSIMQRFRGGLSWSANAGVAIVQRSDRSDTSVFGDVSLCRTRTRSSLCLSGSYAPSTTGIGSVRNQFGVSANYSYRLAERTSLSASVGYSRLSSRRETTRSVPFVIPAQSFLTSDLAINRRFSRLVSGYVGVSYRKLDDSSIRVAADYGVRAGLAFTLGGRR